nr:DEAD/DEAH box helicase [Allosaccharopolyspora coralli]
MAARGRLRPGVSNEDVDVWRPGPWDAEDLERIDALAAAMPAEARAIPVTREPLRVPRARTLVLEFVDAVIDTLPRTPAAELLTGTAAFACSEATPVPQLREWAQAMEPESGVRVSVRLEIPGGVHEWADDPSTPWRAAPQVQSLADPTQLAEAAEVYYDADGRWTAQDRIETMRALQRAARAWDPLRRALRAAAPEPVTADPDEVEDLFTGAADRLGQAGVEVHWPRELTASVTAGVRLSTPTDVHGSLRADESVTASWHLRIDDHDLTANELDTLAATHQRVVRLRDQWVLVDPDIAAKAAHRTLAPLSPAQAVAAALTGTVHVAGAAEPLAGSDWRERVRERLAESADREPVDQPPELTADLRDYQLHGLRWLVRMTDLGLGCCLADDMGLGKTITLVALYLHRRRQAGGPMLVVCPASVLGNWERELHRFAPGTPVRRFHGPHRSVDDVEDGVVLTTYGTMRLDADSLARVPWDLVVADEAQHAKNPAAATARALRRIPAAARVALTGTPVENNLTELWALLDWATPGLLGTLAQFRARYIEPVEVDRDPEVTRRLTQLTGPFLLRRRKTDPGIAPELPPKTETDHPLALTPEQIGLYEAVVRETMQQIRASDGMARRGLVMKLFTALKQICNHPAQYLGDDRELRGRSGKLDLLDELVDTVVAEDGAMLVFTQYVTMARLLRRHLQARGHTTELLHGGTPLARREAMVRRFQAGQIPVFLLSLKAAGTGLNLTRADHVVHLDRWWNPAVEDQATDRAHRIGQDRPVQVHRLIAEGTVEDHIDEMLRGKRDLAEAVLSGGEAALTELSDDQLAELVDLRGAV